MNPDRVTKFVPVGADKAALGPDAGKRSLGAALSGAEGGAAPQRVKRFHPHSGKVKAGNLKRFDLLTGGSARSEGHSWEYALARSGGLFFFLGRLAPHFF